MNWRSIGKLRVDKNSFNIDSIGKTEGDRRKFETSIIANLGDNFYKLNSYQALAYEILKQIEPIRNTVKNTPQSVEKHCKIILDHYGLPYEVTVVTLFGSEEKEVKNSDKSSLKHFLELILDISQLPSEVYKSIEADVYKDFKRITDLVAWYESQPAIIRYLNADETPKKHEDRIVFDFYKRCFREQKEIANFYFYGIKERTRFKCRRFFRVMDGYNIFGDRPYYFARSYSIYFFDCRKLDLVSHRLMNFGGYTIDKMIRLYSSDKNEFYTLYFKRNSLESHFENINFYLQYLPLKNNRTIVFDELVNSFRQERWMSFYALAIPQVEGLFSEMINVLHPDRDFSQKALTYKVNKVRPFYLLSGSYFDYFQYHVPLLRNRFAHTGYDEDFDKEGFKLKSYDLLLDLTFLLQVFCELDNSLVKVKRILKDKNSLDFDNLKSLAVYINILKNVTPKQYDNLTGEIAQFESEFLFIECNIEHLCQQLLNTAQNKLDHLIAIINEYIKREDEKFEFIKLDKSEITKLSRKPRIKDSFEFILINLRDEIEELQDFSTIVSNHKKHLPSIGKSYSAEFDKIAPALNKNLWIIAETKKVCEMND